MPENISLLDIGANFSLEPLFVEQLKGDLGTPTQPRQTPSVHWSQAKPTKVNLPTIIGWFEEVSTLLELPRSPNNENYLSNWLGGNTSLAGSTPFAACYGGHQFGHWAGQLGDGRAISIAEIRSQQGHFELQLKGAGLTPYSRTADGRAVLRSSIREFLCSEAMHHLGIPTTRALSLVLTGDQVVRDILYNGNPKQEPGAIVCRVAPSFIRFGNFEILAARNELSELNHLIDFTITNFYPHLSQLKPDQQRAEWFKEVCTRTAFMIAEWQRVGFVHGVMNTDNMSILGLTIDYGPYGWLDNYDPTWTPNTTDAQGRRYRFENQPFIGKWNLTCLANALATVIDDHQCLYEGLNAYEETIANEILLTQCKKFGLFSDDMLNDKPMEIFEFTQKGLSLMHELEMDHTLTFLAMQNFAVSNNTDDSSSIFADCFYKTPNDTQLQKWNKFLIDWLSLRNKFLNEEQTLQSIKIQQRVNPQFILRNYLSQIAIEKAELGDYEALHNLMNALKSPYDLNDADKHYMSKRPDWAKHKVGCSMLSCSS